MVADSAFTSFECNEQCSMKHIFACKLSVQNKDKHIHVNKTYSNIKKILSEKYVGSKSCD